MVDHVRIGHIAAETLRRPWGPGTLGGGRAEKEVRPPLWHKSRISDRKNAQTLVNSAK
jgi:hypothetical protein